MVLLVWLLIIKKMNTKVYILVDTSPNLLQIKGELSDCINQTINTAKLGKGNVDVVVNVFGEGVQSVSDASFKKKTSLVSALESLNIKVQKDTAYLISIITDHQELKTVPEFIKLQENDNVTVTYLGANHDLGVVSKMLGIPKGNISKWEPNALGSIVAQEKHNKYLGHYLMARSYGTTKTRGFYGSDQE